VHAAVLELEPGAGNEILDRAGDEDFARTGMRRDASPGVYRDPRHLSVDELALAGMDSDRTLTRSSLTSPTIDFAQRIARAGPSNAAKKPSPAVSISRPRALASSRRTTE
jgi:hypothetical protein